ncbi:hypothetical protein [Variovorax paradoxus]|uniref:hypothetical protein n=1 Tax=Variovorax paradoxus TaxID=34073 RepID=UPI0027836DF7|nr:hypothetical protein [Variovorax paradoxus]MDQ0589901.1 hypothetical protein [Variovorax paradoxus]
MCMVVLMYTFSACAINVGALGLGATAYREARFQRVDVRVGFGQQHLELSAGQMRTTIFS